MKRSNQYKILNVWMRWMILMWKLLCIDSNAAKIHNQSNQTTKQRKQSNLWDQLLVSQVSVVEGAVFFVVKYRENSRNSQQYKLSRSTTGENLKHRRKFN